MDAALVQELQIPTQPMPNASYVIAGGDTLTSSTMAPKLTWWAQGHTFVQDMKVLPLGCYDLIVGVDWLEEHNPMWVHWHKKWMKFTHDWCRITLRGVRDKPVKCKQVTPRKLKGLLPRGAIQHGVQIQQIHQEQDFMSLQLQKAEGTPLPPEIKSLLHEFDDRFQPPTKLPSRRPEDHTIPLIPGAQPVSARPYRYTPQQKDEIQRLIREMLCMGIIRPSTSPLCWCARKTGLDNFVLIIDSSMLSLLRTSTRCPLWMSC